MSALLITFGVAAAVGQVEVIQCPAQYQRAPLIGAGMFMGEQKEAEMMGAPRKVRGGIDADYGYNPGDVKWVACWYKSATPRWYRVNPAATRCELKERGTTSGKVTAIVRCK